MNTDSRILGTGKGNGDIKRTWKLGHGKQGMGNGKPGTVNITTDTRKRSSGNGPRATLNGQGTQNTETDTGDRKQTRNSGHGKRKMDYRKRTRDSGHRDGNHLLIRC